MVRFKTKPTRSLGSHIVGETNDEAFIEIIKFTYLKSKFVFTL